jgi:two-component system, sensor histidine kinase and response regulator
MNPEEYKILAVDDNPKNLKVLAALLSNHSYLVDYAFSGIEALKLIENENYDVILLDIMMPEMDGFETCEKIRQIEKNKDVPIIFLTAKTETDSITRGFQVGGYDYVTKPFRSDELLARVRTHVELKRHRDKQKEINRWLEEKVEERTQELSQANLQLEKANRELTALDRAKNEFLRMINHEIRTPLNAILGFTAFLKDELKSEPILEMVEFLDIASVRLEKFLMVVLQITELITKDKPVQAELVVVKEIVSEAQSRLKNAIIEKKLRVGIEGDAFNIKIPGNKKLLFTCFECILNNAIKYSPDESVISIQSFIEEDKVVVEFIDEGSGFSEEAMNSLFQFFAVGEQHVDQNAGLGLAMVKLIMDTHQGNIEVWNNEIRGATVKLSFIQ